MESLESYGIIWNHMESLESYELLGIKRNSEFQDSVFTPLTQTLVAKNVKEVGTRFDNSSPDSPNDLCCRSSRLCWVQNLILNRMVLFSKGVNGQKIGFCLKNCFFHIES
jgi:hypothetical protein